MTVEAGVVAVLNEILNLNGSGNSLSVDSALLGAVPEFDSMAIVNLLAALEEKYDLTINDDEIDADVFETVSSLVQFVTNKLG